MSTGLNIDHAAIIDRAQDRSAKLREIETHTVGGIHLALDGLKGAENWVKTLWQLYVELDKEGKDMLPEVMQRFIQGRYFNSLDTVIKGNGEMFPGLEEVIKLFPKDEWVPEPMHPYDDLSPKKVYTNEQPWEPDKNTHGQFYELAITFEPAWDSQEYPNGAWKAQYKGCIPYGVGPTPDKAFAELQVATYNDS